MGAPTAAEAASAVLRARGLLGLSVGGIVHLEHVNLVVGSRAAVEAFYFDGLGATRDPSKLGTTLWANVGSCQQLHLVSAADGEAPQVVNGALGLAVPSVRSAADRLDALAASKALDGTEFCVLGRGGEGHGAWIEVRCPFGNVFHLHEAGVPDGGADPAGEDLSHFERLHGKHAKALSARPGMPYALFCVAPGFAARVARFYTDKLGAPSAVVNCGCAPAAAVSCGANEVMMLFVEGPVDATAVERQSGMHVCVYVTDFVACFERVQAWTNPRFRHLDRCDNVEQAVGCRQFRFKAIEDEKGALLELEHETRALTHASYMAPLVYNAV